MGEKVGKAPKVKMKPPLPPSGNPIRPPIRGSRLDAEGTCVSDILTLDNYKKKQCYINLILDELPSRAHGKVMFQMTQHLCR